MKNIPLWTANLQLNENLANKKARELKKNLALRNSDLSILFPCLWYRILVPHFFLRGILYIQPECHAREVQYSRHLKHLGNHFVNLIVASVLLYILPLKSERPLYVVV